MQDEMLQRIAQALRGSPSQGLQAVGDGGYQQAVQIAIAEGAQPPTREEYEAQRGGQPPQPATPQPGYPPYPPYPQGQ